jgi:hypothetical protein
LLARRCERDLVGEVSKASFAGLNNRQSELACVTFRQTRTCVGYPKGGNGP